MANKTITFTTTKIDNNNSFIISWPVGRCIALMLLWDNYKKKDWINVIDAFTINYNSTVHRAHKRALHEAMFGWKMHCIYDTPDEEENAIEVEEENTIEVDEDNQMSVSDAVEDNQISVSDAIDENVIEHRMSRLQHVQQSVNDTLDKYRLKLCRQGSVHRKKTVNNTIEAGTPVIVAPDHDMNPKTRKRKLQLTFSQPGKFKRLTSNNRTAIVEVNGKDIPTSIERIKVVPEKEHSP